MAGSQQYRYRGPASACPVPQRRVFTCFPRLFTFALGPVRVKTDSYNSTFDIACAWTHGAYQRNKRRVVLLENHDEPYCGLTYYILATPSFAPTMSQEGGMFSVRRPREVRKRRVMVEHMRRALLTTCADTGSYHQQHIRDPNARVRHETIDLAKSLWRTCASDCPTSALDIRIAHVPCAWPTFATELPQIVIRR